MIQICSHSNSELLKTSIPLITSHFSELNPNSDIINIASDADPSRRSALNEMKMPNTILPELHELKHFEQQLVLGSHLINISTY